MTLLGDWKWNSALGALAISAAAVVFWPLPPPAPIPEPLPEPARAETEEREPVPTDGMLCYTVQEGDTAEGIARLFVISKRELLSVNQIPAGGDFEPGDQIRIPPQAP